MPDTCNSKSVGGKYTVHLKLPQDKWNFNHLRKIIFEKGKEGIHEICGCDKSIIQNIHYVR